MRSSPAATKTLAANGQKMSSRSDMPAVRKAQRPSPAPPTKQRSRQHQGRDVGAGSGRANCPHDEPVDYGQPDWHLYVDLGRVVLAADRDDADHLGVVRVRVEHRELAVDRQIVGVAIRHSERLDLLLRSASLRAAGWEDALRFGVAASGVMGVDLMI